MDKKSIWYFSKHERNDLLISWLTLSLAFAIILMNFDIASIFTNSFGRMDWTVAIPLSLFAVGTGFVFHELAHRQAARSFGFHSEYRAWYHFLFFAVIMAAIGGFVFAAPGATYFFGKNASKRENGIISVSGPATNIVVGLILMAFLLVLPLEGIFAIIIAATAQINFFFAFFNLLPIFILDGKKVFVWNKEIWLALFIIAAFFAFFI